MFPYGCLRQPTLRQPYGSSYGYGWLRRAAPRRCLRQQQQAGHGQIGPFSGAYATAHPAQGGYIRQFIVGYDGVAVGFEKGPAAGDFFLRC